MTLMIKYILTPRRILITLLVLLVAAVMVRLGIWQLDRLQQRRAANASVIQQLNAPALDLNQDSTGIDLQGMQYRTVTVTGAFDFTQQVFLTNKVWKQQLGVHLLTPFIINSTGKAILVDRGWIPMADASAEKARKYDLAGQMTIKGIIQLKQNEPFFGISDPQLAAGQTSLQTWIVINLDRIKQQINVPLLPVYIQLSTQPTNSQPPYQQVTAPDLSDGPHLSYALQWFSFTTILLVGYFLIIRKQLQSEQSKQHA